MLFKALIDPFMQSFKNISINTIFLMIPGNDLEMRSLPQTGTSITKNLYILQICPI